MRKTYIGIFLTILVSGCKNDGMFTSDDNSNHEPPLVTEPPSVTEPPLKSEEVLVISHSENVRYIPTQFKATFIDEESNVSDVSDQVFWTIEGNHSVGTLHTDGKFTPHSDGTVTITASYNNLTGSMIYTVPKSPICGHILGNAISDSIGGGVNNKDKSNAKGECIKIIDDDNNGLYSSPPSVSFINTLGFTMGFGNVLLANSYAGYWIENGTFGPDGGIFAAFDQLGGTDDVDNDGIGDGPNGQYDRWCKKLSEIYFANRGNWRTMSTDEIYHIVRNVKQGNLWDGHIPFITQSNWYHDGYGWPTYLSYWGNNIDSSGTMYRYMDTWNHVPYQHDGTRILYGMCYSS